MGTPEAVRRYHDVGIAVAVATERGLMTPVVKDVGRLSVTAVSDRPPAGGRRRRRALTGVLVELLEHPARILA